MTHLFVEGPQLATSLEGEDTFHLSGPARQSQTWALCDPSIRLFGQPEIGLDELMAWFDDETRVPAALVGRVLRKDAVPSDRRCEACWSGR